VTQQAIPEELDNENFTKDKIAIIVTPNDKKDEINLNKLRQLLPEEEEFVCLANDKITENKGYFNPCKVKSGGMVKNLVIWKGAAVVMTVNHSKKE
jgi:cobalamin biosynthesis protein CbiG